MQSRALTNRHYLDDTSKLPQMGIVSIKKGIGNNKGQFLYKHEQPPQIFPRDSCHIYHIPAVHKYP